MKASKIIVIAAAAAAIGAAIPVSTLLIGSKELPEMPSGKYEPVAVTTTAALPKETVLTTSAVTTAAAKTTAAVTTYTTAALSTEPAATEAIRTTVAAVTTTVAVPQTAVAQVTAAPKTETKPVKAEPAPLPAPEAEKNPAAQPVPAEAAESDGSSVTYKGKQFSTDITELDLSGKKISEAELPELKEVAAKLPNLQKIVLCDCGLSNETLANLQNELGIRVVWRVKLGTKWSLRTDAVAFSVLIMDYSHVRMTSADLEVLKYCPDDATAERSVKFIDKTMKYRLDDGSFPWSFSEPRESAPSDSSATGMIMWGVMKAKENGHFGNVSLDEITRSAKALLADVHEGGVVRGTSGPSGGWGAYNSDGHGNYNTTYDENNGWGQGGVLAFLASYVNYLNS